MKIYVILIDTRDILRVSVNRHRMCSRRHFGVDSILARLVNRRIDNMDISAAEREKERERERERGEREREREIGGAYL